jgi:hypothetical protein
LPCRRSGIWNKNSVAICLCYWRQLDQLIDCCVI